MSKSKKKPTPKTFYMAAPKGTNPLSIFDSIEGGDIYHEYVTEIGGVPVIFGHTEKDIDARLKEIVDENDPEYLGDTGLDDLVIFEIEVKQAFTTKVKVETKITKLPL